MQRMFLRPGGNACVKVVDMDHWGLAVLLLAIFLLIRRIPGVLSLYRFIPDVKGWREALFCGHFGEH